MSNTRREDQASEQDLPDEPVGLGGAADDAEREAVEREHAKLREFVDTLSMADIRSGNWFEKLCAYALQSYTEVPGIAS